MVNTVRELIHILKTYSLITRGSGETYQTTNVPILERKQLFSQELLD